MKENRFKNMSPEKKLQLTLKLYYSARELKKAGLIFQHPEWPEKKIEEKLKEIFLYART